MSKFVDFLSNTGTAFLGGVGSLIAGIKENKERQKIIAEQQAAQAKENDAQRAFNMRMAEWQNSKNIEFWARNNDYNSPVNVMARLREAGINPHMYYSKGNSMGGISSAAPQSSDVDPVAPLDTSARLSQGTSGQAIEKGLNNMMMAASIRKTNAEASLINQKKETESFNTDIFKNDATFRAALNSSTLRLNDIEIELKGSQKNLSEEQVTFIRVQCQMLDKQMAEIDERIKETQARTDLLEENKRTEIFNRLMESARVKAYCEELASKTQLNVAQARDIYATQASRILNLGASTSMMLSQSRLNDANVKVANNQAFSVAWDTKLKSVEFDMNSGMKEWRMAFEKVEDVANVSVEVLDQIQNYIGLFMPVQKTITDIGSSVKNASKSFTGKNGKQVKTSSSTSGKKSTKVIKSKRF